MSNITMRDIAAAIHCSKRTIMVLGPSGCGKTVGIKAEMRRLGYEQQFVFQGPACQPEDWSSMPFARREKNESILEFLVPATFAQLSKDKNVPPTLIMFDELTKAEQAVRNAMLTLTEQPCRIHGIELHPNVRVVLLGNIAEIGAGDRLMPHELNRVTTIKVENPSLDVATQVMLDYGFDGRIVQWVTEQAPNAIISWDPEAVTKALSESGAYWGYDPRKKGEPYCSMRSLEAASDHIKQCGDSPILWELIAGDIGARAASAFRRFLSDRGAWVKPSDVWAKPTTTRVPSALLDQRAVMLGLTGALTKETIPQFVTYSKRIHPELQNMVGSMISKRTDANVFALDSRMTKLMLGE